jgi:putative Mn2+ efflux pump MntP
MSFTALLILSFGVAMDAAAVSAARGFAARRLLWRHALLVAVVFGGFQALMPVLGWAIGASVGPLIEAWDHWVAFGLLAAIGGHMLWEARHDPEVERGTNLFGLRVMLVLGVATSIDALAVGITLPMLGAPFAASIATIGLTTALVSALALYAGRRFGRALGARLDVAGGLMVIAVGTRILVEHLSA